METTELMVEGDVNFSEERRKWDQQIIDPRTRQILDDDARYFLHQSMSSPCLEVLDSCKGSGIKTLSGNYLLDFHGNNVHQLGYGNDDVVSQIIEQMQLLPFSPRRYTNQPAVELAKKLAEMLPGDVNRSLFAPGGTSVIGMALKLARVVTKKHKIVSLWDSFHGASLDAISAGGELVFKKYMGPIMPGVICIPPPTTYWGIFGDTEADQLNYADYLEYVIEKEGDIGAFLAETVRNTDVQIPTRAYWKRVREICTKHKVLLILDEIPIALGRTGKMFAFENYEIEPDILCLGKGLGGGIIPFAAMVTRDRFNVADDISLGHYTHEKSPLGSVAALATINYIEKENLLQKVVDDGLWMKEELNKLKEQFQIIGDVRGLGLLWGIELVKDRKTKKKAKKKAEQIMYECMHHGLSFKVSQGNVLQLSPALTINREDLQRAISILAAALAKYS
ncbi:MAG: aspartate aminotransferase family protein [Bacteroidota bacterium]|nr:aspartate aminotransferase family protein [Bacteroidota bacterium]